MQSKLFCELSERPALSRHEDIDYLFPWFRNRAVGCVPSVRGLTEERERTLEVQFGTQGGVTQIAESQNAHSVSQDAHTQVDFQLVTKE